MSIVHSIYPQIISLENLFQAWSEFKVEKRNRKDVQIFEKDLENNLFQLHEKLKSKTYKHSSYIAFNIYDPKFRHIHKASVSDRVVHHAIISKIEPLFDKTFIIDSYSCRTGKGLHRAVKRLSVFIRKVSRNYKASCFALKLDIKKFFESIDHAILIDILKKKIKDKDLVWLIQNVIYSFSKDKGIPIGNLTSQIFANIYLNELDQFVKHKLKIKYYIRYCDDFVILSSERDFLESLISRIDIFLEKKLKLSLHENKIIIRKYIQGIDFLGYIVLPYSVLPRTRTKKRVFKKLKLKLENLRKGSISKESLNQTVQAYLGYLKFGKTDKLQKQLKNEVWFWENK